MLLFRFQMRLLHILRRKGTTFFLYTQIFLQKSSKKVKNICVCRKKVVPLHAFLFVRTRVYLIIYIYAYA